MQFQVYRLVKPGDAQIQLIHPGTSGSEINVSSFTLLNGSANYTISNDSYQDYLLNISAAEGTYFTYNATFYPTSYINESLVQSSAQIPEEIKRANLALPDNIDPQLRELAANLTNSSLSLIEQAEFDRDWVHDWVEYDLYWASNVTISNETEMANWTYSHRKGICAHYATLYTVIARLQGIPTRVAAGFAGGYPSGNASYIFPMFGHAWAESYIPPYGWVPLDPTGNVLDRDINGSQRGKQVELDWSDAGKVTIDLRFTLNKTMEEEIMEEINDLIEKELRENGSLNNTENMTNEEMQELQQQIDKMSEERLKEFKKFLENYSSGNLSKPEGLPDMNWTDTNQNDTKPDGNNQNQDNGSNPGQRFNSTNPYDHYQEWLNRTSRFNWTANNFTRQGNWTRFNSTWNNSANRTYNLSNSSPYVYQPRNNASRLREELLKGNASKNGTIVQTAKNLITGTPAAIYFILALILFTVISAGYLLAKSRFWQPVPGSRAENEKALREMFRKVDIDGVIRETRRLGEEGELDGAVVYGYNELADFIAFAFKVANDPSRTAREFESSIESRVVDMGSLRDITYIFEKTRYAGKTTKTDFTGFLSALEKLAERGKKRK
ncbi:Transglutaminase-like superfamily protein [uncultured archaeon]|nr:Transglutaminase-like superfamily protein [uncultured archaeon]